LESNQPLHTLSVGLKAVGNTSFLHKSPRSFNAISPRY
jgi:hypothetical protein